MSLSNDVLNEKKNAIIEKLVKSESVEATADALNEFAEFFMEENKNAIEEFKASQDETILAQRGVRQITNAERAYWNEFISVAKNTKADDTAASIKTALPITFIDNVMQDMRENHPLLDLIYFQNTNGAVKVTVNDQTAQRAAWGELSSAITEELQGAIEIIDLTMNKLSAFMYMTNDMLDLGPMWVNQYAITTLSEALAYGLEDGIVDGSSVSTPIGMTRDFSQARDNSTGYPRKTAVVVKKFDVPTFANLCAQLALTATGRTRKIDNIILIVNPLDYFTIVFPASTGQTPTLEYKTGIFPFPTVVVQSTAVPRGYAVFGSAKLYNAFLGTGKDGKISKDKSYKFVEDMTTYKAKLYGTGKPVDINSFLYLDISGVTPTRPVIETTEYEEVGLSSLTIGSLTLTPAFNRNTLNYTAATTAATNAVTAVAKDGDATIVIKNGSTTVTNGSSASWSAGANTLTVKVTNGSNEQTYTVTVTKS